MMTAYFIGGPSDLFKQQFQGDNEEYMPIVIINGAIPVSGNPRTPRVFPDQHRYQRRVFLEDSKAWIYEYTGVVSVEEQRAALNAPMRVIENNG